MEEQDRGKGLNSVDDSIGGIFDLKEERGLVEAILVTEGNKGQMTN